MKNQRCCLPSGAAAKERQLGRQRTRQPLSAAEMNCSHQAFDYPWTYLSFWHPSSSFSLLDGSLHLHRLHETIVQSRDACKSQMMLHARRKLAKRLYLLQLFHVGGVIASRWSVWTLEIEFKRGCPKEWRTLALLLPSLLKIHNRQQ